MRRRLREAVARGGIVPLMLLAAVLGGCEPDVAPPFEIEGTGDLEGRVFYDANEDGTFTPTAGDTVLAGVTLSVRERSTNQEFNAATVTTDDNGLFLVEDLPLGTHDLLVDTTTFSGGLQFCQNPLPVTVYRSERTFEPVDGRASCLVTVAEAEALAGDAEFVTVAGVVTSSPGQITSDNTWVQDETGGVLLFGSLDSSIEVGDFIEVSGTIVQFFNTLEITDPVLKKHVPDFGAVEPMVVTTADIAAGGAQPDSLIQGLLVKVEAAELTGEFGGPAVTNERNAKINDGTGQTELRLYEGVVEDEATLNDVMTVGTCYDITGVVGEFGQIGQLYPRTLDDIVEVPCT